MKIMGIIYAATCLGKNRRPIKVEKFRSMIEGADELFSETALAHGIDGYGKIKDDPRITPLGRLLRRYWLDETPQIPGLFTGKFRLVGIRPRSEEYWKLFPPEHAERALKYRPGLFGVNYFNDGESFSGMIKAEGRYLDEKENRPFLTDVKYFSMLAYRILFGGLRSY
ncbi:sugar transferase [Candidatus Micrarchaeota archaeon]|nr:sugar transferase [Candidatus Micrarchaeota archaeon]